MSVCCIWEYIEICLLVFVGMQNRVEYSALMTSLDQELDALNLPEFASFAAAERARVWLDYYLRLEVQVKHMYPYNVGALRCARDMVLRSEQDVLVAVTDTLRVVSSKMPMEDKMRLLLVASEFHDAIIRCD